LGDPVPYIFPEPDDIPRGSSAIFPSVPEGRLRPVRQPDASPGRQVPSGPVRRPARSSRRTAGRTAPSRGTASASRPAARGSCRAWRWPAPSPLHR